MSLPVIAIVGRPNVGKSTLFNCLTKSRDAIVAGEPGVTRDRLYGQGKVGSRPYIVIDTGGLGVKGDIETLMAGQTEQALEESDLILFVVDGQSGFTAKDQDVAHLLRKLNKPLLLVVNKIDNTHREATINDFFVVGLGQPLAISAVHNHGIHSLIETALAKLPEVTAEEETAANQVKGIKIAVVGRPNVGKSTLINRLLGEERVVVFDQPGTTRTSTYIPYERYGKHYVLIDTAGVRRRRHIKEAVEKFSVIKTLQAIESCHVAVMVLDARQGVAEQDLHLLGFILETGKAIVIAVNKWDGLSSSERGIFRKELDRRLKFIDFAEIKYISALHGTGVGELYPLIEEAYASATRELSTPELTKLLEEAVATHQPPLVSGRRIKLRYAHSGGRNPPCIVIHGKKTGDLPGSYQRFLESFFRKSLRMKGTPIRIELRDSENPYVKG